MPEVRARRLIPEGVRAFRAYLQQLYEGRDGPRPEELVQGSAWTEPVPCGATFDAERVFATRYELGCYVRGRLQVCGEPEREETVTDPAFWAWLAALWFEQLCPRDRGTGLRSPSRIDSYIPAELLGESALGRSSGDAWGRHVIRTSWLLVERYDGLVDFVLSNPPDRRGELTEQLLGRADLPLCPTAVRAFALLYRAKDGKPKSGAAGKGPGTARRFALIVRQLMRTHDVHAMTPERLLELLPEEFDRFRPSA